LFVIGVRPENPTFHQIKINGLDARFSCNQRRLVLVVDLQRTNFRTVGVKDERRVTKCDTSLINIFESGLTGAVVRTFSVDTELRTIVTK